MAGSHGPDETVVVSVWPEGDVLDVDLLDDVLTRGGRWSHGPVDAVRAIPVGGDHGFSGRISRLSLTLADGRRTSLVAKLEGAREIGREATFRRHNEATLADVLAASYGVAIDEIRGRGLILLEDVSPSTQGDDLVGCTPRRAAEIVRVIARLHASTWTAAPDDPGAPLSRWATRDWDPARWDDHLRRAAARYPEQIDATVQARCRSFHDEAADAHDLVVSGPRAWIHHDPHLDNVLWRADGRLVVLDWSGADVLPPSLDVAMLMQSSSFRPDAAMHPGELISVYRRGLADGGVDVGEASVTVRVAAAVRLLVRGLIGWAGSEPDSPPSARMLALRDAAARRARAALQWLDDG